MNAPRKLFCVFITTVAMGFVAGSVDAAQPQLVSITDNGPAERCLDIVIVAEGYVAGQYDAFIEDATALSDAVLSYGPYAATRDLVNVHGLFVASTQAGADHPSAPKYVTTAFDATYETGGIKRLLTTNEGKVLTAVSAAFADWDLAVVLVNDAEYGGSGGQVPAVSTHTEAINILRHELAHNIGGVADEYEAPYPGKLVADPEPNVALKAHLHPLKWQHWVDPETAIPTPISAQTEDFWPIGAYEGARYQAKGMFRPAPTCIMRELSSDFCPVCFEAVTKGMVQRVEALVHGYPTSKTVICGARGCPSLRVDVDGIEQLKVRWLVDGTVKVVTDMSWWRPSELAAGVHTVIADVRHTSAKIRKPAEGIAVGTWQWQVVINEVDAVTAGDPVTETTSPTDEGCVSAPTVAGGRSGWWVVAVACMLLLARRRRCESQ